MYRNPSPPPSKEADSSTTSDFIGNTVYSKHWVLSALVKLLQYAQSKGARVTVASSSREEIEIEDEWEQELCKLWDASINEDVSKFLYEANAADVALKVIVVTQLPRLREICVGLLGNMACCQSICHLLCQRQDFLSVVCEALGCGDTPTLVEAIRLIRTCVCNETCQHPWLMMFRNSEVQNCLFFILESSTNDDLLVGVAHLLDNAISADEELMKVLAGPRCIQAICEACSQVRMSGCSQCGVFIMLLQEFSSSEEGIQSIVECWSRTWPLVCAHICASINDDIHAATDSEAKSTMAACSLVGILIDNNRLQASQQLRADTSILRALEQLQRHQIESNQHEALQMFQQILDEVVKQVQECIIQS